MDGDAEDLAVWDALISCGVKGLPPAIVVSFPTDIVKGEHGLRAWQHLARRVIIVTDESICALQEWFHSPTTTSRREEFGGLLVRWQRVQERLEEAGCKPNNPAVRMSLKALSSKIPEAVRSFEALEAVHPDGIPTETLLKSLSKLGDRFSSVEQGSETGMLTSESGFGTGSSSGATQPSGGGGGVNISGGGEKKRCTFHDSARGCRYPAHLCWNEHVGTGGSGGSGEVGAEKRHPGQQDRKLQSKFDKQQAYVAKLEAQLKAAGGELDSRHSNKGDSVNNLSRVINIGNNNPSRGEKVRVENNLASRAKFINNLASRAKFISRASNSNSRSSAAGSQEEATGAGPQVPRRAQGTPSAPNRTRGRTRGLGDLPHPNNRKEVSPALALGQSAQPDKKAVVSPLRALCTRDVPTVRGETLNCPNPKPSSPDSHVGALRVGCWESDGGRLYASGEVNGPEPCVDSHVVVAYSLTPHIINVVGELGERAHMTLSHNPGDNPRVVVDTAATRHVVGRDTLPYAINVRQLPVPIKLCTANDSIEVTMQCDLPGAGGTMNNALLVNTCSKSLFAAVYACYEHGMGLTVDEGASGARFHKDGKTVHELRCTHNLIEFPLVLDPTEVCMSTVEVPTVENIREGESAHHDMIMGSGSSTYSLSQSEQALLEGACACVVGVDLGQHNLDGHRPALPSKCPYCAQGSMRHRRAERVPHASRVEDTKEGFRISGDFTGPHDPDCDGFRSAFVGVEIGSSKGHVGLQETQGAKETLTSIKQFESNLKRLSDDPDKEVVSFHHDNDQGFRGVVAAYGVEKGWEDTHTGGYDPNANSIVERRIGMLNQVFRVLLLSATGGHTYYESLWGRGLAYANDIINWMPWPDRKSPNSVLSGKEFTPPDNRHVFGAYCLYYINKEQRVGKWQPTSEMGIWVGLSPDTKGGHLICPIKWNALNDCWDILPTVTSTTVKVYDNKFPLRMHPKGKKASPKGLNNYVDKVFHPMFHSEGEEPRSVIIDPDVASSGDPVDYEVECVRKSRILEGRQQYLIKWVGWNNRFNVWRYADELDCPDLIAAYEQESAMAGIEIVRQSLQTEEEVEKQASVLFGPNECHAIEAVTRLMRRQGLGGPVSEYVPGYKKEICNILRRRLILQSSTDADAIRREYHVGRVRMMLELKRCGRKKARLVCQGFREPIEWDKGVSNMSPVAFINTIRMLILMHGPATDMISVNDISVAFLQAHGFDPNDKRYVSYKAYKEAMEHIFELCGPLYGQRVASRKWYETISTWLCNRGFIQAQNEPCLFTHPVTKFKVVLVVDDLLCRGSPEATEEFHSELEGPDGFECGEGSRQILTPENNLDYCGLNISMNVSEGRVYYSIDQIEGIVGMLDELGLSEEQVKSCPMPSTDLLLSDTTPLDEEGAAWCKRALGQLHYYARGSRWDIAHTVSCLGQFNAKPTVGLKLAIRYLAGYILGTIQFKITVMRSSGPDVFTYFTDSNHYGGGRSQTGVLVLMNGAPLHWRSNRQPVTADSPAVSEIYALKEGIKDGKLIQWVAEEMGIPVSYPFVVQVDNRQAQSFQWDTCPNSKIRGSIDMRESWVKDMRDSSVVRTEYVCGEDNLADMFTKCLMGPRFNAMVKRIVNFQQQNIVGGHVYLIDLAVENNL